VKRSRKRSDMKNVITAAAVGKIVIAKNQYHDDEKQENLVSL